MKVKGDSTVEKKLLHYTTKAVADFNMIQTGDKVMVCLSGGKDSYGMLDILMKLVRKLGRCWKFEGSNFRILRRIS